MRRSITIKTVSGKYVENYLDGPITEGELEDITLFRLEWGIHSVRICNDVMVSEDDGERALGIIFASKLEAFDLLINTHLHNRKVGEIENDLIRLAMKCRQWADEIKQMENRIEVCVAFQNRLLSSLMAILKLTKEI